MSADRSTFVAFLQKDYELKIRYLSDHFTRIWARFNFFVTMQTALSVALFGWFKEKNAFDRGALTIAIAGMTSCACWYAFGAQDRYLVALYREHILIVSRQLAAALDIDKELSQLPSEVDQRFIAVGDVKTPQVPQAIHQWRFEPLSTTKLVAWFPIVVALYWLTMITLIVPGRT